MSARQTYAAVLMDAWPAGPGESVIVGFADYDSAMARAEAMRAEAIECGMSPVQLTAVARKVQS